MQELQPGLWHWQAPHPAWTSDEWWPQVVSSYAFDDGARLILFDPLAVPAEIVDLAAEREPVVVLTAPWHERDAQSLVDRLRLGQLYRDAPPGDLFLVLHRHRRDAFPSTGCPHLAQTVVSVIGNGERRRPLRLPRRGRRSPAEP